MSNTSLVTAHGSADRAAVDQLRDHVHGLWASVAGAWKERADFVDARHRLVTERMLAVTDPRPGDRVLELASAAGGVGLAAAARVTPGGQVVLSDVVPEMTEVAAERAAALGVTGVTTLVLDLESVDADDASFDVVLCRDGLQFTVEPVRAASEIRRILRPGGRAALVVWAARDQNPWLGTLMGAVSAELGRPVPPPGLPNPFSLGDADQLATVLREAGFDEVTLEAIPVPLRVPTFQAWWSTTTALAGPLANQLASLPDATATSLRDRARAAIAPYATEDGFELPGVALLANVRQS